MCGMSELLKKQHLFASLLTRLLVWLHASGYQVSVDEGYRPKVTAEHYASIGKGSKNSLHTLKLAQDLNLFRGGVLLTKMEEYRAVGEFWKALHPLCRWGGDFTGTTGGDARHFSIEHQGRK